MNASIFIQHPVRPERLFLLFHGVGSTPDSMVPIGRCLAQAFPQAAVVSIASPQHSDMGRGFQWFSVVGVTEENRASRIAEAMPGFVETVRDWQGRVGLTAKETVLLGFSQGAIMALESTQLEDVISAGVVSLSGRFAQLQGIVPTGVALHFLHGQSDPVILPSYAESAVRSLSRMGARVTLDLIPGLGHQVTDEVLDRVLARLHEDDDVVPDDAEMSEWFSWARRDLREDGPLVVGHLGRRQLVLAIGRGSAPQSIRRLPLGADAVAARFFQHCPPTAGELERAIEAVEDEVMSLHVEIPQGSALFLVGESMSRFFDVVKGHRRDDVEEVFQRLSSVSQGVSSAGIELPDDNAFAASVLLLREFMHHIGFEAMHPLSRTSLPT